MREHISKGALALALLFGSAGVFTAQTPPQPTAPEPSQPPMEQPAAEMDEAGTVTLTGCLREEADIPGGDPNVAEEAGILEDYFLTDATPEEASATGPSSAGATSTSGVTFQVTGLDDEELQAHLDQRVAVTGEIAGDAAGDEPQELEATSIRMFAESCTASPS